MKRYYPYSTLCSHVIGFCGSDNQGLDGVEAKYDEINKTHRSVHGKIEYLSDFNRDKNRDIMDASSIQKYIANID